MSLNLERPFFAGEFVPASDTPTVLRPAPEQILGDISVLYQQLSGGALLSPDLKPELHIYTGMAQHVLNPTFAPHFRDIDLSTRPQDIPKLMDIIPTIKDGPLKYLPGSMQLDRVAQPLFENIESHRLSFQAVWKQEDKPESLAYVYEVELFDNNQHGVMKGLLENAFRLEGIPTIEKGNFKIWHPWLTVLLYQKMQAYEEAQGLKQDRARHRYETMLAALHASRQYRNAPVSMRPL